MIRRHPRTTLFPYTTLFRSQAKDVAVTAATELYFDIRALPVEQGRPFTGQEVQAGVPVLVLGHELADKLFEGQDPIGREVRIFGLPYRVIGVRSEERRVGKECRSRWSSDQ